METGTAPSTQPRTDTRTDSRSAPWLLGDIEAAVRGSWDASTTTPEHRPSWSADNPARDQCGVTALVINDLLGGDLIRGEVHADGEWTDYHWWNRLGAGVEIDLTREQFGPHERVSGGTVIARPEEIVRLREEYELLRDRVLERLRRE
ncbi:MULTISPECIES: YunG family protein [unclassified Streptomyces]|uniref:YunG family protein n=1 Tax=unclassified Streptomyces TaxID=2593676 RepID=UPI0036434794